VILCVVAASACGESASSSDNNLSGNMAGMAAAATGGTAAGSAAPGGAGGIEATAQAGASGAAGASAGAGAGAGASGTGGSAGSATPPAGGASGSGGAGGTGGAGAGAGGSAGEGGTGGEDSEDPIEFAAELHELFMHDECTGMYAPQPDTCLHEQLVEQEVTFGGESGTVYDVVLRVRGLFEPTTISGAQTPLPQHPYFKVGGTISARDWSAWHIEVSDPAQTYWLNHYPSTAHLIYKEDFEAPLEIAGGATVTVRVVDGNDRQMDNAEEGLADRRQLIEGVTDQVMNGQLIRLDVISVEAQ
jgi:hypothetical protein